MKINILYFTILFSLFLNSSHLKAAPNSGTLLNFENELRKFNKLPKVIPEESNFINGEPVQNGEKLLVKGFRLVGKKQFCFFFSVSFIYMFRTFNFASLDIPSTFVSSFIFSSTILF